MELDVLERAELETAMNRMSPNFQFNEKALIIKTNTPIPEDVKIGFSFGWKFLFPYITTNSKMAKTLAQLEDCIDDTIDPIFHHEAYREIQTILRDRKYTRLDNNVQWLRFLAHRMETFLKLNPDIFASRSDKGAHTVILDNTEYDQALAALLNTDTYTELNSSPLMKLIHSERNLVKILKTNHKSKEISKGCFEPALLILVKFYGLVKIHKPGFCLRPIMAMNKSPGFFLGKIFNKMINTCFAQSGYHLKDSYQAKQQIDQAIVHENQVLVSFDVVSMYTNIPTSLAFDIVFTQHKKLYEFFGMGKLILKRILNFLLNECTAFTALDKIYKQVSGLPMGSSISTNLARLVMDRMVENLLLNEPSISFIRVFVDDTIVLINKDKINNALTILNNTQQASYSLVRRKIA